MSILNKYFETEAGLTRPSVSLKKIARGIYWLYLILGVIAMVGCLIGFFNLLDWDGEMAFLFLILGAISPLVFKLMGWLSSLSLRAIAVVVESHEKNLGQPGTAPAEITWTCKSCGRANPKHVVTCASCGGMKEDRTEAMQAAIAEKFTAAKEKAAAATEKVTATSDKVVSAARKFFDSKPKKEPTRRTDGWQCTQCGAGNPVFVGSCNQCGAVKPRG